MRPAPGLCFNHDENACVVVDTMNDDWIYLSGDAAWAWSVVSLTGNTNALSPDERTIVKSFIKRGLLWPDPPGGGTYDEPFFGAQPEDISFGPAPTRKQIRKAVRNSWLLALRYFRSDLYRQILVVAATHSKNKPYVPESRAQLLYDTVRDIPAWVPKRCRNWRMSELVTVLAADRLGLRMDWVLGVDYEGRSRASWCRTPEAEMGKRPGLLAVETF